MSGAPASPVRTRTLLAAGAALVALALAAVFWMTRTGPAAPGPASGAGIGGGDAAAQPAAGVARPADALPVPASARDDAAAPAGPSSVEGWSDVPLAARLSNLGPLARPVYDGLQKARAAMEPCFQADAKDEAAHPRAPNQEDGWGAAIVTLQMEGRPGELVIVNAPLQSIGTSSLSLVECCEKVLRGFRIPADAATPGKRYRLQHQLIR